MKLLQETPVIIIDCQAASSRPSAAGLFEIGWLCTRAGNRPATQSWEKKSRSFLINPGQGASLPDRITRVTGITNAELSTGKPLAAVKRKLDRAVFRQLRGESEAYAIIHYARYEVPLLREMYRRVDGSDTLPFRPICTHRIFSRLVPDLPRKGLRAVAGYFGCSIEKIRRCSFHVLGTAHIWHHLVRFLAENEGIETMEALSHWLARGEVKKQRAKSGRVYPMDRTIRLNLPESPGIYRMLRSNGDLLYIGKARSLRKRVNSYFQKKNHHPEHVLEMLSQARDLSFSITGSVLEAAIRESDEIKKQAPPYNIALQKKAVSARFFSADLLRNAAEPGPEYPLGPLFQTRPIEILGALFDNLSIKEKEEVVAVNIQQTCFSQIGNPPTVNQCRAGITLFREKHGSLLSECGNHRERLKRIGALIRHQRLSEMELGAQPDEVAETLENDTHEWTAEGVTRFFEHTIHYGAHALRRAKWLTLLSDSVLTFDRLGGGGGKTTIRFEGGFPVFSDGDSSAVKDKTNGLERNFASRQNAVNSIIYDRLMVVSAELKRMQKRNERVEIQITPQLVLQPAQLKTILKWV